MRLGSGFARRQHLRTPSFDSGGRPASVFAFPKEERRPADFRDEFWFRAPFGISFAFGVALSLENRFQWMKDFGAAAFTLSSLRRHSC